MKTPNTTAVIIESPYAGDIEGNKAYLQACIRYALSLGLTPYASHQMLTEALQDAIPEQRNLGIFAGFAMRDLLLSTGRAVVWFCTDRGWSKGMLAAKENLPVGTSSYLVVVPKEFFDAPAA